MRKWHLRTRVFLQKCPMTKLPKHWLSLTTNSSLWGQARIHSLDCGCHTAARCVIWRNCHVGNKKSTTIHSIYAILASLTQPQESVPFPCCINLVTPYIAMRAFLRKYMILILSMRCQQSVEELGWEVVGCWFKSRHGQNQEAFR